ncbi:uncharacterized protein J4E79_010966 [Alternaria viburni]|uniref:uncharacterized protein n=1 Tax=Alternaria viburni TaxID=566460 RepID=UPI0020C559A6|nr:uncharacterized protein J4E79_010966 [Alternaria viburni]KAI4644831.1 hypothetical protein J4E79_010966 [Alternaria viburni]
MDRGRKRALSPSAATLAKKQKLDADDKRTIQKAMARFQARERSQTRRDDLSPSMSSASMGKGMAPAQEQAERKRNRLNKITELNATRSPLLRLPTEIRDMIYTHVFRDEIYHLDREEWQDNQAVKFKACATSLGSREYKPGAILFVSRQVYHEAALLPYKLAEFDFGIAFADDDTMESRLSAIKHFLEERSQAQVGSIGLIELLVLEDASCRIKQWGTTIKNGIWWATELGCDDP